MPALDLVYNPVSGSFSDDHLEAQGDVVEPLDEEALRDALIEAGFRVTPMPTTAAGARLSGQADLVCVHGGDGTLRDTVQALGERAGSMPICVAPSGTINLVARELGYPRSPRRFAEAVREAWDRGPESWVQSPLYRLGDMPIVSCVSIGPDSHAVARVDSRLKQRIGRYAYVVALAQQMREWPRDTMTIRGELADGERFEYEAEAAIVSHAALYAGPFQVSPGARLGADSVELITVKRATRLGTIALSLGVLLRLPLARMGIADIRTCRRIEFDRCVTPVQVDGDHMPECAFAIAPSGLTLSYVV